MSGHSHLRHDWQDGPVRRINPGALHRTSEFTVALLDLESGDVEFLTIPKHA